MESSDEEEVVLQSVMNYYFEDGNRDPISFSELPIVFDESERPGATKSQVFLHGTTDGGLQKVFKQVTAWKLGLDDDQPEIFVMSKDNKWIKLLKPRKVYEEVTARSLLVTVHLLHFLRKKPESSEKSLWAHLEQVFRFENEVSEHDLREHHALIKQFIKKDETLEKSELLSMFLGRPRKNIQDVEKDPDTKKSFIVDANEIGENIEDGDGSDSEEESDLFDSVCSICDNGGELLCCEGRCLRSFHATRSAGVDSDCKSLGYSRSQVETIQNFYCKNCQYKQHQCFACGKLGSSDKSANVEVFSCVNATCGRFFHPTCAAKLLYRNNVVEATECREKIAAGESFTCPVHKCVVCDKGENKEVKKLQFAMCRRCPKSYHRGCLPREIAFGDSEEEEEEDIVQRAWDDLLPNRILIYCLDHEIDEEIGTPIRNHIVFPEIHEKKVVDVQKSKVKALVKKNSLVSSNLSREQTSVKSKIVNEKSSKVEGGRSLFKAEKYIPEKVPGVTKKVKLLKESTPSDFIKRSNGSNPLGSKASPKEKANALGPTVPPSSVGKISRSSFPVIDSNTEKKMAALMENASSSLTLDYILKKRTMPLTHAYSARLIDKTITPGKVEGSIEAIRTALKKMEDGGNLDDAKAVCEPEILKQLVKWNSKLRVYLSPFLHGVRYTSFGRHFTKVDKLMEIVDKLQWYVKNGDMIVDFCCGSNDFSQLMKEKLEAVGKKCLFKNYDVIHPKNDFNFERRDWMTVQPRELPTGSQLIMGLNPPFGIKAALANKFINKALDFRPKLIILIVPPETERLDRKRTPYDLIWEDCHKLSGKSFYLPGSVDVNDKQIEQWNNTPPVLYLWSRSDWTVEHKAVASKRGHTSDGQEETHVEEVPSERPAKALPLKENSRGGLENESAAPEVKTSVRREGSHLSDHSNKRSAENRRDKSRKIRKTKREKDVSEGKKIDEHSAGREVDEVVVGMKASEVKDMSISPPHNTIEYRESSPKTSITLEAFKTAVGRASNKTEPEFRTITGSGRSVAAFDEDIDGIAKRYTTPLYNSGPYNYTGSGTSNLDYGIRSSEERSLDYVREDTEPYGRGSYGNARFSEADALPQRFSLGSSVSSMNEMGRYSSPSFGLQGSTSGPSAMQRYAPRLDETNYAPVPSRDRMYDMPGTRDIPPNSMRGFALGPQRPFPHQGTSGWLDD